MLWTLSIILVVLWLAGFGLHMAGGLIHLLLVAALIELLYLRKASCSGLTLYTEHMYDYLQNVVHPPVVQEQFFVFGRREPARGTH